MFQLVRNFLKKTILSNYLCKYFTVKLHILLLHAVRCQFAVVRFVCLSVCRLVCRLGTNRRTLGKIK